MKPIIILLVLTLISITSFSQVYKKEIVRGKHVAYEVTTNNWTTSRCIKNINNRDTSSRQVGEMTYPVIDVLLQVAGIVYDNLQAEEILRLKTDPYTMWITLRLDSNELKISQVQEFYFSSDTLNDFWVNLLPDRLYQIEKVIIKKVEVPTTIERMKDISVNFRNNRLFVFDMEGRMKERKKLRKDAEEENKLSEKYGESDRIKLDPIKRNK